MVLSQVHYWSRSDTAAMVTVSNCYFQQAFYAQSTRLYAQRTVFDSHSYMSGPPSMGLSLYKSYAELSQCTAKGSDNIGHAPSLSAVVCAETVLVLRGTSASRYIGGNYAGQFQSPAIDGKGTSWLHHDPAIGFTGSLTGMVSITKAPLAALTTQGGGLGTAVTTDLWSAPGDTWLLYLSLPTYPLLFEPFGEFVLDLGTLLYVGGASRAPAATCRSASRSRATRPCAASRSCSRAAQPQARLHQPRASRSCADRAPPAWTWTSMKPSLLRRSARPPPAASCPRSAPGPWTRARVLATDPADLPARCAGAGDWVLVRAGTYRMARPTSRG
ncbi:MAG: hypothetical protein R3F30_04745 [Planctomycetota bacterium]